MTLHSKCRQAGRRSELCSWSPYREESHLGVFLRSPQPTLKPKRSFTLPKRPCSQGTRLGKAGSEARSKKSWPTQWLWLDSQLYPLHWSFTASSGKMALTQRATIDLFPNKCEPPPESRWQVSSVSELGVGFKGSEHTWENWGSLQKRWGVNWASRHFCLFWRQNPDSFKNWSLVPIICLLNGSCKYTSKCPWSGEILSIFQCCTNGQCLCMIQWHKHVRLSCPVPFLWRPLTPLVFPVLAKGTLC